MKGIINVFMLTNITSVSLKKFKYESPYKSNVSRRLYSVINVIMDLVILSANYPPFHGG